MIQKIFFTSWILLLLVSNSAIAQGEVTSSDDIGLPVRVAFYGDNGVNPGLRVGTFYKLHENVKVRTYKSKKRQAKKGARTKVIQYRLDGNFGFYNQPNNHFGLLIGTGITRHKRKNESKWNTAWSLEVNYLRRFYNIKTFEIDANGSINEIGLAGNNGVMFSIAPALERSFGEKEMVFFLKPAYQVLTYNHAFSISAVVELGITFNLFKS